MQFNQGAKRVNHYTQVFAYKFSVNKCGAFYSCNIGGDTYALGRRNG